MKELKFLFQILSGLYRNPSFEKVDIDEIEIGKLLYLAKENNLLYYVCVILKKDFYEKMQITYQKEIDNIINNGEKELEKINKSILIINNNLDDYLLIKTWRGYPRIANDLDILVKNFDGNMKKMQEIGLLQNDFDKNLKEVIFKKDDVAKIHLHGKIGWLNRKYFDDDFVFNEPRSIANEFEKVPIKIPNFNADFLIHVAHMNFEPMHFTLSELLYLYNISEKVDLGACLNQSKKYCWKRAFMRTLSILDEFHFYFYGTASSFSKFSKNRKRSQVGEYYMMPKSFSRFHIVASFLEKGVIMEPIKKIGKVLKILVKGNTRDSFYEAPENNILKK